MSDVFGLSLHTPMARSLVNTGAFEKMSDVPCDVNMFSQQVFLIHGDKRTNFRPSLVIQGRARSAILHFENEEQMVLFSADEDNCPYVSFIYEFSEEELKAMIDAGYFTENFYIPDIFINNVFEQMPAPCDIYVLSEEAKEPDDTPIILFDTRKWYDVVTNGKKSGYENLGDSFERYVPEPVKAIDEIQVESDKDADYLNDRPKVEAEPEPEEKRKEMFAKSIIEQAARIQKRVEEESEKYKADIARANEAAEEETEVVSEAIDMNDDEDDDDPKSSDKKHVSRMKETARRLGTVDQKEEVAETEAETVEASDIDAAF